MRNQEETNSFPSFTLISFSFLLYCVGPKILRKKACEKRKELFGKYRVRKLIPGFFLGDLSQSSIPPLDPLGVWRGKSQT